MQKGIVYRSTGSWYDVKLEGGDFIKARIQGKFRNLSIRTTNPVSFFAHCYCLLNSFLKFSEVFISPQSKWLFARRSRAWV